MTAKLPKLTFNDRDEFAREQVAEKVIKLLKSDINISPMVIDGDWGTGKTEFCHKLINKMESEREDGESFKLLYIDAFQADHADNPLMTILAAVLNAIPDEDQKQKDGLLKKSLPVLRYGLSTAGKALVGHLLKANADEIADDLEKHLEGAADKVIDASVTALLKDHEDAEKNLEALQNMLEEIAKDSPLTLFIDELDRCRPDFSVQMLEVIKHTFDVPGVQFVLVTNKKQLRAAINNSYGSQVDAQRYLDKFLKFSFKLPSNVLNGTRGYRKEYFLASFSHFINLVEESSSLESTIFKNDQSAAFTLVEQLVDANSLSLREIETFVRHLEIYQTISKRLTENNNRQVEITFLRVLGVFISCFAPETAASISKKEADAIDIANLLGVKYPYQFSESHTAYAEILAVLIAQECARNKEGFIIPEEYQQKWSDFKRHFIDSLLDVIKETNSTLLLENRR